MRAYPTRKVAGAAGVILLHVGVIAALLNALYRPVPSAVPARERIVWFAFAPKSAPAKKTPVPARPQARILSTPYPDYRTITIAPMTGQTDLGALHGFLFDCAPENLINLTAEQRAGCVTANAGPKPDDSVDYADHTNRSKNAVRWARGQMRKQQPLRLPCMPPGLATLICLGNGISDGGFDLDMQPSYGDKPRDVHVPNNGDPPNEPPG